MTSATINGNTYSDDSASGTRNLDNGGHRQWFLPLISDVTSVAGTISTNANTASNAAAAAASSLVAILAVSDGSLGIGTESGDLTRVSDLGRGAFVDIKGVFLNTQNTTYQIVLGDREKLLLTTSGTNTWTLPAASDVPMGWYTDVKNRSGNNLTINRSGSDTINNAATSLTVTDGTSVRVIKASSTTWESY